jgi:hypothetical protein
MRLEDAKSEVLSWLDPMRSPRIEEAFYLTEAEAQRVTPDEGYYYFFVPDEVTYYETPFPSAESQRLLAVIVASSQGMDILHQAGEHAGQTASSSNVEREWPGATCFPVPASRRQRVVAMFDAATGKQIGAGPVFSRESYAKIMGLAAVGRTQLAEATPLSIPTSTEPSTDTPPQSISTSTGLGAGTAPPADPSLPTQPAGAGTPRPLARGEVPSALLDVVRDYPLVNGSQWVYRMVSHGNNVRWSRQTVTRTIDAAWMLSPEVMLLRQRQQASGGAQLPWYNEPTQYLYVFPEGISGNINGMSIESARAALATMAPPTKEPDGWPKLPIGDAIRFPLRAPERVDYTREMERQEPIAVAAGTFPSCFVVRDILNAGNSSAKWLCRDVGFVREEYPGCSTMHGGHTTLELLRYSIPTFRPLGSGD